MRRHRVMRRQGVMCPQGMCRHNVSSGGNASPGGNVWSGNGSSQCVIRACVCRPECVVSVTAKSDTQDAGALNIYIYIYT